MFNNIFIEKDIADHPQTLKILEKVKGNIQYLDRYDNVWGKVKKPYLQKRDNLNLFIAEKKGELVKEAPAAYGLSGEPHYYYIHAYNCIYECEYCYLQGYFHSPDLVFFINHDQIIAKMKEITLNHNQTRVWFHAGEFSDSLALAHITNELPLYWDFFENNPNALLELRSKSANIRPLLQLKPLSNTIVSFSLSPANELKDYDRKTPGLTHRLNAIEQLANHGHKIGIHLDPIIYAQDFKTNYTSLVDQILKSVKPELIEYISLGVVRFTKDVFSQMKKNYPDSKLLQEEFITSFDNKVRYSKPHRLNILKSVEKILLDAKIEQSKIYLCMED